MTVEIKAELKIARVFPRRTKYGPLDEMAFYGPPTLFTKDIDEVHVSCVFSWDKKEAERLARQWEMVCSTVKLGGPAFGSEALTFTPGMYVRNGYVMTSRGCPRSCYFCIVPKLEGALKELEIHSGPWIIDNNLLSCSDAHVEAVFQMLEARPEKSRFLGGMDCHYVKPWHIKRLGEMRKHIDYMWWAYDQEKDRDPIDSALEQLHAGGMQQRQLGVYVLCGFKGDTIEAADKRCEWVFTRGGLPFPMYYRGPESRPVKPRDWSKMCNRWTFPPFTISRIKKEGLTYHEGFVRGALIGKDIDTAHVGARHIR